jgi:hypothetical protein
MERREAEEGEETGGRAVDQASHRGASGLTLAQVMWDLWWTKWHCSSFLRVLRFLIPPGLVQ